MCNATNTSISRSVERAHFLPLFKAGGGGGGGGGGAAVRLRSLSVVEIYESFGGRSCDRSAELTNEYGKERTPI